MTSRNLARRSGHSAVTPVGEHTAVVWNRLYDNPSGGPIGYMRRWTGSDWECRI
jgi:hypothetical protein